MNDDLESAFQKTVRSFEKRFHTEKTKFGKYYQRPKQLPLHGLNTNAKRLYASPAESVAERTNTNALDWVELLDFHFPHQVPDSRHLRYQPFTYCIRKTDLIAERFDRVCVDAVLDSDAW